MSNMKRREFITLLGGVIKWAFVAHTPRWDRPFAFMTAGLRFREVACWDRVAGKSSKHQLRLCLQ